MSTLTRNVELSGRDRALLIAVGEGRCVLVPSGVPDLLVDGRWFCDQLQAHALSAAGLLTRADEETGREPTRAQLTAAGRAALAS